MRIIIRPRSIVRSVIRFRSNTIVTRLKVPSVGLPVDCTFSCPGQLRDGTPHLSFARCTALAFRRPSVRHFHGLTFTFSTIEGNNGVPYVLGTTGRMIITTFLHSRVNFLRVDSIVRGAVTGTAFVSIPACRSCITASTRTEGVTRRFFG